MYIVLKSCGDLKYATATFTTSSEEDAKLYAQIMERNDESYKYYVVKLLN